MKEYAIKKKLNKNQLDDLTDGLVNAMHYSDSTVEYPLFDNVKPDDGVIAEWFYPILNIKDFSELSAILMYTTQEAKFEEIGELMLGIGLVEMKHYSKIGDFILHLGGKIEKKLDNFFAKPGETLVEALNIAIEAESKTIEFYNALTKKLEESEKSDTVIISLQLIAKLIADEKIHSELLNERKKLIANE